MIKRPFVTELPAQALEIVLYNIMLPAQGLSLLTPNQSQIEAVKFFDLAQS
jgi:hypothetical protein